MRTLIAFLFAAFAYVGTAHASTVDLFQRGSCGDPCVVKFNPGGAVVEFILVHDLLLTERRMLVVDGPCYSACSFLADMLRGRNLVCITDKAEMFVHKGSMPFRSAYLGTMLADIELPYTKDFQSTVDRLGGAPKGKDFRRVAGADLTGLFKVCPAKVPSSPVP